MLGTERAVGMAEGPVPFTGIDRFARRYGIDDLDDFETFVAIVRGMDAEYLTFRSDSARRAQELNEVYRKQKTPLKLVPKPLVGKED